MEQIIVTGRVERGRIDMSLQDRHPSINGGRNGGALIPEVTAGSPAEKAGLRKGDLVTMADDRPIRTAAQLRNAIGLTRIGQDVKLTVERGGKFSDAVVKIAPAPATSSTSAGTRSTRTDLGVHLLKFFLSGRLRLPIP